MSGYTDSNFIETKYKFIYAFCVSTKDSKKGDVIEHFLLYIILPFAIVFCALVILIMLVHGKSAFTFKISALGCSIDLSAQRTPNASNGSTITK